MAKKKHKKPKIKAVRGPRNPYAFDPIMKKGGVHEKPEKVKRQNRRTELKKEVNDLL